MMAILSSKSNSGWASLPEDVLGLILDYLVPMEDYLAFSEVCNQWEDAVREKLEELRCNRKRHCCLHQQVPLLLAPSRDNTRNRFCLFDVMKGKSVFEFELRVEQPENWRFEGSSHGWFILFNIVSFEVNLFNPFSGETIRLPPLQNSTFCLASSGPVNYLIIPSKRRRCVLSMDIPDVVNNNNNNNNDNDNEVVLMMTCKASEQKIAFIKLGDQQWTYVHELGDSEDIACINGVFYIVDKFGVPFSARVNYSNDNHQHFYKLRWIPSSGHHGRLQSEREYYLVESPEGDLLRVVKIQNKTTGLILFMIYKLIWFSRNPRWEEVTELGDVALFLGDNHSISVKASAFPGCKRNSIYFCHYAGHFFSVHGSVHVFSLTNRTTTLLYGHFGQHVLWISSKFL